MKSLRDKFKYVGADGKNPIRNYMCGEYGTLNGRPHYHACLFNVAFDDKKLWKIVNNNRLYVSDTLEKLWKKGFPVTISTLNPTILSEGGVCPLERASGTAERYGPRRTFSLHPEGIYF